MPITSVTQIANFPTGMDADDLLFDALLEQMIGDDVYIGVGTLSAVDLSTLTDQVKWDTTLGESFDPLGELAEKAGKIDSKLTSLKTRNYKIAAKRTTSIEVNIVGISDLQKQYLESNDFSGTTMCVIFRNREKDRVIIFNGMKWTCDWSGEVDGLFAVLISTEFSGITNGKIHVLKDIPVEIGSP